MAAASRDGTVVVHPMSQTAQIDRPWKFWLVRTFLVAATLVYVLLVLDHAKPVDWNAPWLPEAHTRSPWFYYATIAAFVSWADGWLIPWIHRKKAALSNDAARGRSRAFGRFVMRAAMFCGGAACGGSLSFLTHDGRYAIVSAAISVLMILLLPRPNAPELPPSAS
jgi:membrane protease YdiL (CAAX protease family)